MWSAAGDSENRMGVTRSICIYNYNYNVKVDDCVINNMRDEFKSDLLKIFDGKVSIISEDEMFEVVDLIGGEYPHCNSR